jgi:serine/threonine protein phosphatase PrpC
MALRVFLPKFVINTVNAHENDLDTAAKIIVDEAFRRGSTDNLTAQIVRIDELPTRDFG